MWLKSSWSPSLLFSSWSLWVRKTTTKQNKTPDYFQAVKRFCSWVGFLFLFFFLLKTLLFRFGREAENSWGQHSKLKKKKKVKKKATTRTLQCGWRALLPGRVTRADWCVHRHLFARPPVAMSSPLFSLFARHLHWQRDCGSAHRCSPGGSVSNQISGFQAKLALIKKRKKAQIGIWKCECAPVDLQV